MIAAVIDPTCVACGGTGSNSRGHQCSPCKANGAPTINMKAKTVSADELPPSLSRFEQTLRDYQNDIVHDAMDMLVQQLDAPPSLDKRRLYGSPTGTGKGTAALALLVECREVNGLNAVIVTPGRDIIRGFLERLGAGRKLLGSSAAKIDKAAEACGIWTPTRLRNRITEGILPPPEVIIYDEGHHAIDDNAVSGDLFACCPYSCFLGLTATIYRGTPRGTLKLREAWGEPVIVMTWREAVEAGWVAMPILSVVPLVDDDQAKVNSGEFQAKSAGKLYASRIEALADLLDGYVEECRVCGEATGIDASGEDCTTCGGQAYVIDKPTLIAVPSTELVEMLMHELDKRDCPAHRITQDTKPREREEALHACRNSHSILVQISVISEGVDIPELSRIVDAKPTLSPVCWLQFVGRALRPGYGRPEIVVTNRNLERHCYLMSGCIPASVIRNAQTAFEKPSTRSPARQLGLERLARFKVLHLPLADGRTAAVWSLYTIGDESKTEWCAIVIPGNPDPLVAKRVIGKRVLEDGTVEYMYEKKPRWHREEAMPDELTGFATSPSKGPLSDPMRDVWKRHALKKGLTPDPDDITRRHVSALFVLLDAGMRIRNLS